MAVSTIVMIIVVLLLLYVVMKYVFKDANTITGLMSGTVVQSIAAKDLAKDDSGLAKSNFAYSIWYYIDDWNYNYNKPKVLFIRTVEPTQPNQEPVPCPSVTFTPNVNNLAIQLALEPEGHLRQPPCIIENVPIQKWTHVTISVYGRSLDVYLDGKLVKTCTLDNTAFIDPNANVYITPKTGFSGWTSKFAYYPNALNPQQVWDIYSAGYGSSWLSNLFGSFNVKISFLENGAEDSSFTF